MTRILTVDDDEQNRELLRLLMERFGYEVVTAVNGAEALREARRAVPDMIISDILMPVMDGYTLCRECKSDDLLKSIPFIFYTGTYTDSEAEALAIKIGAERFLKKPTNSEVLRTTVEEVLDNRQAGRSSAGPAVQTVREVDILHEYTGVLYTKLEEKITELERANQQLERSEQRFRTILEISVDAIVSADPQRRITVWSSGAEHMFGFTREEIIGRPVEFMIPDHERAATVKMVEEVLQKGFVRGYETHRLTKDGHPLEVEMTVTDLGVEIGTVAIVRDISKSKQAEKERQRNFETLQKAFEGTIQAMALTVDRRDPYTAGHQRRVADLATAIGREMGLESGVLAGIGMAGAIHDLGKISIPAEILSKPTKLSEIEINLIRTHPQTGYDILKEVEFPWPVAQIVLQHHERVNGSGYPQGLSGNDILPEARTVAVADVVEAIASYRPYRPAFGIVTALDEISKNIGVLYDEGVSEACLRLFNEKGFELKK